jgi:hypothetical protein
MRQDQSKRKFSLLNLPFLSHILALSGFKFHSTGGKKFANKPMTNGDGG